MSSNKGTVSIEIEEKIASLQGWLQNLRVEEQGNAALTVAVALVEYSAYEFARVGPTGNTLRVFQIAKDLDDIRMNLSQGPKIPE